MSDSFFASGRCRIWWGFAWLSIVVYLYLQRNFSSCTFAIWKFNPFIRSFQIIIDHNSGPSHWWNRHRSGNIRVGSAFKVPLSILWLVWIIPSIIEATNWSNRVHWLSDNTLRVLWDLVLVIRNHMTSMHHIIINSRLRSWHFNYRRWNRVSPRLRSWPLASSDNLIWEIIHQRNGLLNQPITIFVPKSRAVRQLYPFWLWFCLSEPHLLFWLI